MCSSPERAGRAALAALLLAGMLAAAVGAPAAPRFVGIGRDATPAELAAWDIDVRPDFNGLPRGGGSVVQGMVVWEAKCAGCHGVFGEDNQTFTPLAGGTNAQDVLTGRTARLKDPAFPARTTLMKLPTLSTLWDYIRRAMPWNAPKSLATDEVYAVTAYLLFLGGVLPESAVLSDANIAQVQQRLPNRDGMTTDHALWPGRGLGPGAAPDVRAGACLHACAGPPVIASRLPDFARNQHGNLALQNRSFGPQRGIDTALPAGAAGSSQAAPVPSTAQTRSALALTRSEGCAACHAPDRTVVGPAWRDIAVRYRGRADAADYLAGKIRSGGAGLWGAVPMPQQDLPADAARRLAQWLAAGAPE